MKKEIGMKMFVLGICALFWAGLNTHVYVEVGHWDSLVFVFICAGVGVWAMARA